MHVLIVGVALLHMQSVNLKIVFIRRYIWKGVLLSAPAWSLAEQCKMSRQKSNNDALHETTEQMLRKFKRGLDHLRVMESIPAFLPLGTIREEDLRRTTQLIHHFHEGEEFHTLCKPRDLFQQCQWYKDRSSLPLWCVYSV